MTSLFMDVLDDLKDWLREEETREELAPSSCEAVLDKIKELEELNS
jgi:hypothetical protein